MADKKISDFTEATSVDNSDWLEIENTGGNSRKIKASNLKKYVLIYTYDQGVDGNLSTIPFSVSGYDDVIIEVIDLTNSSSIQRAVQVSTDGGASYYTGASDYSEFGATGVVANNGAFFLHTTAATAARSCLFRITDVSGARNPRMADLINRGVAAQFIANATAITHMRVMGSSGGTGTPAGTYNGGKVRVFAR